MILCLGVKHDEYPKEDKKEQPAELGTCPGLVLSAEIQGRVVGKKFSNQK